MSKQHITLSTLESEKLDIPDNVQRMGMEALQLLWHTAQRIGQQEIDLIKKHYQQVEKELLQQREEALQRAQQAQVEITAVRAQMETVNRENKSLQVDLNRQVGELKSALDQSTHLEGKLVQQEGETKRLTEELGRAKEQVDNLQKRLYEVSRQAEQDREALKTVSEEGLVNLRTKERLEANLRTATQESEQVWKQLKIEQTKAAVAESLVQELREVVKKLETEVKLLKDEKQELRGNLENEAKARVEVEKRLVGIAARAESQEWGYKEMLSKLELELGTAKSEMTSVRSRMIKAEGALEREKKAIERLESKLVAVSGK